MTIKELQSLARHSRYASWAIWTDDEPLDDNSTLMKEYVADLHSKVVIVGLNVSTGLPSNWGNFHGGKFDRKLRYAFNDSPYRGAYMTDVIKDRVQRDSATVRRDIALGKIDLDAHARQFKNEMDSIGAASNSLFILMGAMVGSIFQRTLASRFPNSVQVEHYSSYRRTRAVWLDRTWSQIEAHARATASQFDTLPFSRSASMRNLLDELRSKS